MPDSLEWNGKGAKIPAERFVTKIHTRGVQSRFLDSFFRNGREGCATLSSDLIIFNEHASEPAAATGNRSPRVLIPTEVDFSTG